MKAATISKWADPSALATASGRFFRLARGLSGGCKGNLRKKALRLGGIELTVIFKRRGAAVLLLAAALCGCAAGPEEPQSAAQSADQAERMLARALTAMEKSRPELASSRTEVIVGGVAVPGPAEGAPGAEAPSWPKDPYEAARLLQTTGKTVALESRDPADPGLATLSVTVDQGVWTGLVKGAWTSRLAALQTEGAALIREQASRVSGSKSENLKKEMNASLETAAGKLGGMIGSLEASGVYRFRVRQNGAEPEQMIIENRLRYNENNTLREETVRTLYDFKKTPSR
jgi:hypothetical protein